MLKYIKFICVNYNNTEYTIEFCESLLSQFRFEVDIKIHCTVVDNSTNKSESIRLLEYIADKPWVFYLKPAENIGYFPGLNFGLNASDNEKYKYVVICNNDLTFDGDFCSSLLEKNYDNKIMVICPDVVTKDGIHQNPHNLFNIGLLRRFQFDLFFTNYYIAKLLSFTLKFFMPNKKSPYQPRSECEIHMGVGACYVLTGEFFRIFNKLDYPHFLYAEEAYLTNQIHTAAGMLWFDPDLRVQHAESASLSKIPKRTAYEFGKTSYWGCRGFLLNKSSSDQ